MIFFVKGLIFTLSIVGVISLLSILRIIFTPKKQSDFDDKNIELTRNILLILIFLFGSSTFGVWFLLRINPNDLNVFPNQVESKKSNEKLQGKLELLGYTYNSYDKVIVGRAVNKIGYKINYASVSFNLYNKQEELVGTAFANITDWNPGITWTFKAYTGFYDDVHSVKMSEMTGY